MSGRAWTSIRKVFTFIVLLYLFLISINLMGHAFKGFGKDFAEQLIQTTSNPFVALFIGIFTTSLIQSSSTTTSIVVGMVSAGTLTVPHAIPIVMGANIGTSVTNTIVSFGHITRKEEFKRAFSGALIHDIFNLCAVLVLFPLELYTHFLEKSATLLSGMFTHSAAFKFTSPIKAAVKPVVSFIEHVFKKYLTCSDVISYSIMLVLSLIVLFTALYFIVRVMRSLVINRTEVVLNRVFGLNGFFAICMGALFTALVQSSSVTTSLLVPLTASGIITLEQVMPITLGANIGTTITAILASLAGNQAGVTIAFCHLLFNIAGILIFYPIKFIRNILLFQARNLSALAIKSRLYAVIYLIGVFFLLPFSLIFFSRFIFK